MNLYTVQIAQWRKLPPGVQLVDVSVRSGDRLFAPTWDIVMCHKNGSIGDDEYTSAYLQLMRDSYHKRSEDWLSFCQKERVAIACYCKAGVFCHRHILKDVLGKVCCQQNIPFTYLGEITAETPAMPKGLNTGP